MNSGGEPERDDTGLPPVDIEIPDDARELDRDVQAYYREQRAERRRMRHRRLHGMLTRDGILLPLLACCLILAIITGTLLTVFTATSDQNLIRPPAYPATGTSRPHAGTSTPTGAASSRPAALVPRPLVVQTGYPLPTGTLTLRPAGRQIQLRSLAKSLLVLVPPACGCSATVSWLAGIGASQGVPTYLVSTPRTAGEANRLHSGLPVGLQPNVQVAIDKQDLLGRTYHVNGPTAIMVATHRMTGQSVAYAQNLSAKDSQAPLVQALSG